MLFALADNGGPDLAHALPANSMAVDNGGILGAIKVDQRGVARDSLPDIGAYELVVPGVNDDGGGGGGGSLSPWLLLSLILGVWVLKTRATSLYKQ